MLAFDLHTDASLTDSAVKIVFSATSLANLAALAMKLLFASVIVKQATDLTEIRA